MDSGNRLAKITILSSDKGGPGNPNVTSTNWVMRDYREEPYDSLRIIDFKPPFLARHLVVFSENDEPLSLAEVEIYGMLFD